MQGSRPFSFSSHRNFPEAAVQQEGWRQPLGLQPGHKGLRGQLLAHVDGAQLVLVLRGGRTEDVRLTDCVSKVRQCGREQASAFNQSRIGPVHLVDNVPALARGDTCHMVRSKWRKMKPISGS